MLDLPCEEYEQMMLSFQRVSIKKYSMKSTASLPLLHGYFWFVSSVSMLAWNVTNFKIEKTAEEKKL